MSKDFTTLLAEIWVPNPENSYVRKNQIQLFRRHLPQILQNYSQHDAGECLRSILNNQVGVIYDLLSEGPIEG